MYWARVAEMTLPFYRTANGRTDHVWCEKKLMGRPFFVTTDLVCAGYGATNVKREAGGNAPSGGSAFSSESVRTPGWTGPDRRRKRRGSGRPSTVGLGALIDPRNRCRVKRGDARPDGVRLGHRHRLHRSHRRQWVAPYPYPPSSDNTFCELVLAIARTAVPALVRI